MAPFWRITKIAMPYRAHFPTWTLAGLLILVLLSGTVFGCAAGLAPAVYLPVALLELPAPDLSLWHAADEPRRALLDTVLPASPGRAPPALPA